MRDEAFQMYITHSVRILHGICTSILIQEHVYAVE